MTKRGLVILAIVLLAKYGALAQVSLSVVDWYIHDRLQGVTHEQAMCNTVEWVDQLAWSLGLDYQQQQDVQSSARGAYCGE